MDMAWIEGFVKAAADHGLSQEEATQLLKVAQRLQFLKQNPEKYAEGFSTAIGNPASFSPSRT